MQFAKIGFNWHILTEYRVELDLTKPNRTTLGFKQLMKNSKYFAIYLHVVDAVCPNSTDFFFYSCNAISSTTNNNNLYFLDFGRQICYK